MAGGARSRREASGTDKEQEARRLLRQREGAAVEGRVVVPRADRVTIAELAENLKADEVMLHEGGAKLAAYAESKVLGKVKGAAETAPS